LICGKYQAFGYVMMDIKYVYSLSTSALNNKKKKTSLDMKKYNDLWSVGLIERKKGNHNTAAAYILQWRGKKRTIIQ
jgi:hypothetical protein